MLLTRSQPLPVGKSAIDIFADFCRFSHRCVRTFIEDTYSPDVSEEISFLVRGRGESDFGQFVNFQEQSSECDGKVFANAPRTSVLGLLVSALVPSRLSPPIIKILSSG